jgi:uncharacterized protein (DUF2062 family)
MSRLTKSIRRVRDWFVRLLHLDDSPHRIALGAAVGMFIAMTPTVGFQMLIVLFLLWFIPGNRAAGVPIVWVTNPATILPIYGFNYWLGATLLDQPPDATVAEDWGKVAGSVPGLGGLLTAPVAWLGRMWDWLGDLWRAMEDIMGPLWLGSVISGVVAGLVAYALMYYLVDFYRKRLRARLHLLARLQALRARKHADRVARKARTSDAASPGTGDGPRDGAR